MDLLFNIDSYDYYLPEEQIAQTPSENRDGARLLSVNCSSKKINDGRIDELDRLVLPGDLLVVNDTKVFPARLLGKKESGGKVELMLLHYPSKAGLKSNGLSSSSVKCLVKASIRPKVGSKLIFGPDLEAVVLETKEEGTVHASLEWQGELDDVLCKYGNMPLPPYIKRDQGEKELDRVRYQTVYARENGAIAAPTAGLHFSDAMISRLKEKGCEIMPVTLHVGYGTFAPVRVTDIRQHLIHSEFVDIPLKTVQAIKKVKYAGGRVWAVGTTSARALEFAADKNGEISEVAGECDIYIYPGYEFKVVDNLITNFHLPKSSLLFMVSAFAGRELVMQAYEKALSLGYRFYSYGDAMVLIK